MDYFEYKNGEAHCEGVPLERIAEEVGTPTYVYSLATLKRHCNRLKEAFKEYPTLPCFAVKANSNLSVLREIFATGFGADVVSVGEMERALLAGAKPNEIVFSGVGKRDDEIRRGIQAGILSFNVESAGELANIARIAEAEGKPAPISLRFNPNIEVKTNPYIATGLYTTKFGIAEGEAEKILKELVGSKWIQVVGLSCHIGSQITDLEPFQKAIRRMVELSNECKSMGHPVRFLDLGGGLGIKYRSEEPPSMEAYAQTLIKEIRETGLQLVIEPGRVVVGNVGVLLTRVLGTKQTPAKNFTIVDAAMNDLLRPSLYKSYHDIETVKAPGTTTIKMDVVGPICETSDSLGLDRDLPEVQQGDLLMIKGGGAYGATMASTYNSRPKAPEVLVDGDEFRVVRKRETLEDLWRHEQ